MAIVKFYRVAFNRYHKDIISKQSSQAYLNACEVLTSLSTSRFIKPEEGQITLKGNVTDVTNPDFNYMSFNVGSRTYYAFVTGFSVVSEAELVVSFEIDNYMTYPNPEISGELIKSQYFRDANIKPFTALEVETGNNRATATPLEQNRKYAIVICVVPSSQAPSDVPSPLWFALYEKDFVNTVQWLEAYSSLMNSSTMRAKTGESTYKEFTFTYSKALLIPDNLIISVQDPDFYSVKLSGTNIWQSVSSIQNGNKITYTVNMDYHKKQSVGVFTKRVPIPFTGNSSEDFTIQVFTGNSANPASLNGNFAVVMEVGDNVLDITDEFNISISQSSYSQYLAQNGTTLAVNSLSSVVGAVVAGASGGPVGALAGGAVALASQGVSVFNQISSARKSPDNVQCSGDFAGLVNYRNNGVCLFETNAINTYQIDDDIKEQGFSGYNHINNLPLLKAPTTEPTHYFQAYTNLRVVYSTSPYLDDLLEMYGNGVNVWTFPTNYTQEQLRAWRPIL